MAKIYKSLEENSKRLSKWQKIREQECQHCQIWINVENCQKCVFAVLSNSDIKDEDDRDWLASWKNHKRI